MISEKNASTRTGPYKELRGLSSETKPTNVANGSTFLEINSGTKYMFDETGNKWDPVDGVDNIAVEALTVTQNGTTTAPSGKAYSPVTVNVPSGYQEYTKTANSFSALQFSSDELAILKGSVGKLSFVSGQYNVTSGVVVKQDEPDYFIEIGFWLLFVFLFGYITLGASSAYPHLYACTLTSPYSTSTYDASGATNVSITFYVTAQQKAQLDAL